MLFCIFCLSEVINTTGINVSMLVNFLVQYLLFDILQARISIYHRTSCNLVRVCWNNKVMKLIWKTRFFQFLPYQPFEHTGKILSVTWKLYLKLLIFQTVESLFLDKKIGFWNKFLILMSKLIRNNCKFNILGKYFEN